MMVDDDVAYPSPSSVYRIMDRSDLLCRWKPSQSAGRKPAPPTRPHQQWHTDLMYIWVGGRWHFFIAVLDGYSRYIVHWDLLLDMRAANPTWSTRPWKSTRGLRPRDRPQKRGAVHRQGF